MQKPISILDVGGKINFWENRGLAGNNDYKITVLNIEKEKSNYSNINCLIGDATNLNQFKNKSFDIVHRSNMSKLCCNEQEAIETVEWYKTNDTRYDSPTIRKADSGDYWVVYNESTGKILKNYNYIPAGFECMTVA